MGAASERRALLLEADDSYDPFLTVDVNEYLIEEFKTLTAKQRQSVWHLCQNDEDFNYDSIHDQIDDWVYEYAESNSDVVLDESTDDSELTEEEQEEEEEQQEEEYSQIIYDLMCTHLENEWPDLSEEQVDAISNSLVDKIDELEDFFDVFVYDYAKESDSTIDVSEMEETSE